MKPQEAIKYIQEHNTIPDNVKDIAISSLKFKQQFDEIGLTIEKVKELKEKSTPKKPNKYDEFNCEIHLGYCPDCDNVVNDDYCECCGQALDWSEIE